MRAFWIALGTRHLQTPFVLAVLALMVLVLWLSQSFSLGAGLFPTVAAAAGIGLALLELARQAWVRGRREEADFTDLAESEQDPAFLARGLLYFGWVIAFAGLLFVVGAIPAAGLFTLAFLRVQFASPWWASAALAAGLMGALWLLGIVPQLRWPPSLLPLPG